MGFRIAGFGWACFLLHRFEVLWALFLIIIIVALAVSVAVFIGIEPIVTSKTRYCFYDF